MSKADRRNLYTRLAAYYDQITPKTTAQECKFLDSIFRNYKKAKIIKILDLGCGTGRHAGRLTKMGYRVVGIDLAEEMLEVARAKYPGADFKKMNFINPQFPKNSFDASICMWTTISYILSKGDFKKFVKNVASVTQYLLILDSSNYENPEINKSLIGRKMTVKFNETTLKTILKRQYNPKTKFRTDNFIYILTEKNKEPVTFKDRDRTRIWPTEELELLMKPQFRILNIYGSYSLKEKYSPKNSYRRIIVGERA